MRGLALDDLTADTPAAVLRGSLQVTGTVTGVEHNLQDNDPEISSSSTATATFRQPASMTMPPPTTTWQPPTRPWS